MNNRLLRDNDSGDFVVINVENGNNFQEEEIKGQGSNRINDPD